MEFDTLEIFCTIVGNSRTGSTLLGSLLDAHPNIAISNESAAPNMFIKGEQRENIFNTILRNCANHARAGKKWTEYQYSIPGQWQGKHKELKVIGDKLYLIAAYILHLDPNLLINIDNISGLRTKYIHCTRNPFDVISTMALRSKLSLRNRIGLFFNTCEAILALQERVPAEDFLTVNHESLLNNPKETLTDTCYFLNQEPYEDYLQSCSALLYKQPHKTRTDIMWPEELINLVKERIQQYDFLAAYDFED